MSDEPTATAPTGDQDRITDSAATVTHDHGTPTGWFADVSDEEDRNPKWPWQPFIQTAGCCFPLPVWFETEDACIEFIRRDILGRGLLDDAR